MKLSVVLLVSILAVVYGQLEIRNNGSLLSCQLNADELHARIPFRKADFQEIKRMVDKVAAELYRQAIIEGESVQAKITEWWIHHKEEAEELINEGRIGGNRRQN